MKRYAFNIEWGHALAFAVFIFGLALICLGMDRADDIGKAVELRCLRLQELEPGMYVSGTVTEVLRAPGYGFFADERYPVAAVDVLRGDAYYVVPIAGDRYITLCVPQTELNDFDAAFEGEGFELFGRVAEKIPVSLNREGIAHALGITEGEADAYTSPDYYIRCKKEELERMPLTAGIVLAVAGVLGLAFQRDTLFLDRVWRKN